MKWSDSIREGNQRGNMNPPPATPKPGRIMYKNQPDFSVRVLLDGRLVGTIRRFTSGWQYRPKGAAGGAFFDTLEACKRSLEED